MIKGNNVKIYGNVEFGKNVIIEENVVIGHPSAEEIKENAIGDFVDLNMFYDYCSKQKTYIGENSVIRSGTVIYSGVSIDANFQCGHNVIIRENSIIGKNTYCKSNTEIMKYVKIGDNCRIAGVIADFAVIMNNVSSFGIITHHYDRPPGNNIDNFQYSPEKAAIIEEECIIGRGAVIVGNIKVGKGSKIGANAFVNFDILPKSFVVGEKATIR